MPEDANDRPPARKPVRHELTTEEKRAIESYILRRFVLSGFLVAAFSFSLGFLLKDLSRERASLVLDQEIRTLKEQVNETKNGLVLALEKLSLEAKDALRKTDAIQQAYAGLSSRQAFSQALVTEEQLVDAVLVDESLRQKLEARCKPRVRYSESSQSSAGTVDLGAQSLCFLTEIDLRTSQCRVFLDSGRWWLQAARPPCRVGCVAF